MKDRWSGYGSVTAGVAFAACPVDEVLRAGVPTMWTVPDLVDSRSGRR
jgi:hypothetical protein